jgi:2-(1,2-epoxy-1,2-dihydrophenyl)acetyl-CoA isomerase
LNRPEVFNSFNQEMAFALQNQLDEAANNAEIRAVVLTGNGKAFCAGKIWLKPQIRMDLS